jgi:metal-sulfur cluster biosynthetic enzyme
MSEDTVQRGAAGMPEAPASTEGLPSVDDLEEAMRDVVDPELGINVVDLGLLYGIDVQGDPAGPVVTLDMTLTSAACPLTDVIEDQARAALTQGAGGGLANDVRKLLIWNFSKSGSCYLGG